MPTTALSAEDTLTTQIDKNPSPYGIQNNTILEEGTRNKINLKHSTDTKQEMSKGVVTRAAGMDHCTNLKAVRTR